MELSLKAIVIATGTLSFRVVSLFISFFCELAAEGQHTSIKRTELRGMAKGYQRIAAGKISLPSEPMFKIGIVTIVGIAINIIQAVVDVVMRR